MAMQHLPIPEDMDAEERDNRASAEPINPRASEANIDEPRGDTAQDCQHLLLSKHWDSVADMGKEDMISSYRCNSCGTSFTKEEGDVIQERQHAVAM